MAKVVVLGGGIGGLSAAHELVERGFQVAVYEQRDLWGGKARSYGKPGSGIDGRKDLPAEHGFRLFPGFYKHLPDTMRRIPFGNNRNGVFDNLVSACRIEIARESHPPFVTEAHFPKTLDDWVAALRSLFLVSDLGLPEEEARFFAHKLLVILTSCQERRLAEYERISWWKFIEADSKSETYQKLLGDGLIRKLVAMQGRQASTRTMGNTILQLLQDLLTPGQSSDRLLNGPTNEVWIDPWVRHLRQQGVELYSNATLRRLNFDGDQITSATVDLDGRETEVEGDYYIAAVPVEVMRRLVTPELKAAAPSLAHLDRLCTAWMLGIQFYLRHDVPVLCGHVVYADSRWALTSISQHQFWPQVDLPLHGNGEVRGILSVDISDWHTPGDQVVFTAAEDCTPEEIQAEVWAQIKTHLDEGGQRELEDADLVTYSLDPDLRFPRTLPQDERNVEPLLVNTAHSWQYRPEADLSNGLYREVCNLFLASDFVRTSTDLATMEGANEAARRAVNAILQASGARAAPCRLWPLEEPAVFAPLRAYDYTRFKLGYRHSMPFSSALWEPVRRYFPAQALSTLPDRARKVLKLNEYEFQEHWLLEAPPEEVWKLVAQPDTYPDWWRQYPVARRLNDVSGVGAQWEMHIQFRPDLPYRLRFTLELERCEKPLAVEWRAHGDLEGRVGFALEETAMGTRVTYASMLRTEKRVLNAVSPLTRPFFVWNHRALMRQAEHELRDALSHRTTRARPADHSETRVRFLPPGEGHLLGTRDSTWTFKAVSADTLGIYSLCEVQDAPQTGQPLRRFQGFDLACYILEGQYAIQIADEVVLAPSRSFVFLPRGLYNGWKNVGRTPGRMLLIISPAGLEDAIEEWSATGDTGAHATILRTYGVELKRPPTDVRGPTTAARRAPLPPESLYRGPGDGKRYSLAGSLFTLKGVGDDTRGAYSLLESQDPSRNGPPLHVHHREDEGFYILDGRYTFQVGDRTLEMSPGSFVFAPKDVPHIYCQMASTTGSYLVICTPPGFENFVAAAGDPVVDRSSPPAVPPADLQQAWERIRTTGVRFGIDTLAPPHTLSPGVSAAAGGPQAPSPR